MKKGEFKYFFNFNAFFGILALLKSFSQIPVFAVGSKKRGNVRNLM